MKLLLINPPEKQMIRADNPEFMDEERGATPPLGILYLAAVTSQIDGWEVEVIDCVSEKIDYDTLGVRLSGNKADLVGITVLTFTVFDVLDTIDVVHEVLPRAKVILGGPHVHIYPEETIEWEGVDIVAMGEGEAILPKFLPVFPDMEAAKQIPGLVFKEPDGSLVNTGKPDLIVNLDNIPFPARGLTDVQKYHSVLSKNNPISTMITSRGCPFGCRYCDRPNMGKKFRAHSAEYVVAEMQECINLGIREIFIYDDTFTVNRKRVMEFCQKKKDLSKDLDYDIRARVDCVDEEMLQALAKSGCRRIHFGVESGTTKIQNVLGKQITLDQAKDAFYLTKKAGIKTLAYFMIGSPTETIADIRESMRFAISLEPDFVSITILTPFPETAIYRQALEEGVIEHDYFKKFARNPQREFQVKYWEKELSRQELFRELGKAYRTFYGRPAFILRELLQVRSYRELIKKMRVGLKVLGF